MSKIWQRIHYFAFVVAPKKKRTKNQIPLFIGYLYRTLDKKCIKFMPNKKSQNSNSIKKYTFLLINFCSVAKQVHQYITRMAPGMTKEFKPITCYDDRLHLPLLPFPGENVQLPNVGCQAKTTLDVSTANVPPDPNHRVANHQNHEKFHSMFHPRPKCHHLNWRQEMYGTAKREEENVKKMKCKRFPPSHG